MAMQNSLRSFLTLYALAQGLLALLGEQPQTLDFALISIGGIGSLLATRPLGITAELGLDRGSFRRRKLLGLSDRHQTDFRKLSRDIGLARHLGCPGRGLLAWLGLIADKHSVRRAGNTARKQENAHNHGRGSQKHAVLLVQNYGAKVNKGKPADGSVSRLIFFYSPLRA